MRRQQRRALSWILWALLLGQAFGVVSSVLVAWGLVLANAESLAGSRAILPPVRVQGKEWPVAVPPDWPPRPEWTRSAALGRGGELTRAMAQPGLLPPGLTMRSAPYRVVEVARWGWPYRAMQGTTVVPAISGVRDPQGLWRGSMSPSMWRDGLAVPWVLRLVGAGNGGPGNLQPGRVRLPLRPLWRGFVLNTQILGISATMIGGTIAYVLWRRRMGWFVVERPGGDVSFRARVRSGCLALVVGVAVNIALSWALATGLPPLEGASVLTATTRGWPRKPPEGWPAVPTFESVQSHPGVRLRSMVAGPLGGLTFLGSGVNTWLVSESASGWPLLSMSSRVWTEQVVGEEPKIL